MKQLFLLTLLISPSAFADLITAEEHKEWVVAQSEKCREIKNIGKQLKCKTHARKSREEEGLYRGTEEYVIAQYKNLSDVQIQEQIELAEKAMESAYDWGHSLLEYGDLSKDDYYMEITAAKRLLRERSE